VEGKPIPGGTDSVKAGQDGIGFLINQTTRAFGRHMSREVGQFDIRLPGHVGDDEGPLDL
jgi:hypothetical protein